MTVRKAINMAVGIKERIEELKVHLKFKTESQVLAYLTAVYDDAYPTITLLKHEEYLKKVKELDQ